MRRIIGCARDALNPGHRGAGVVEPFHLIVADPDRGRDNIAFEPGDRAGADDRRVSALQAEFATAEDKLTRLYTMVENDLTDLDDILKERIATLKSDRDRAKAALARITIQPKLDAFTAEAIERFGQIMGQRHNRADPEVAGRIVMITRSGSLGIGQPWSK